MHKSPSLPSLEIEAFLIASGFKCETNAYSPSVFGNRNIIYSNNIVLVRLTSDRAQWAIEISAAKSDSRKWYDGSIIMKLISKITEDTVSFEDQVGFFGRHLDAVNKVFSEHCLANSMDALDKLKKARAQRLFPSFTRTV